jgi:protein-tyrosine phosphatase
VIDLHCHILPALDDGARDVDDALAMAREAEADGITAICATPHIRHDHEVAIGELAGRVTELNTELERRGVDIRVVGGGEVAETAVAGLDDAELLAVSLGGGGRWILLEPAPGPLSDSLDAVVEGLATRGFRSVIAHPERHAHEDFESDLVRLVRRGALVQVTAAMLEHEHAAPVIVGLAQHGLVHLIASDAHSSRGGRPVQLSAGLRGLAAAAAVADHLDWISRDAPAAILRGDDVEPPFAPLERS